MFLFMPIDTMWICNFIVIILLATTKEGFHMYCDNQDIKCVFAMYTYVAFSFAPSFFHNKLFCMRNYAY